MKNIFLVAVVAALALAALSGCSKKEMDSEWIDPPPVVAEQSDWIDPPPVNEVGGYVTTCVVVINHGNVERLLFVSRDASRPMTQVMGANGFPATCSEE